MAVTSLLSDVSQTVPTPLSAQPNQWLHIHRRAVPSNSVVDSCDTLSRSVSALTIGFLVVGGSAFIAFPFVLLVQFVLSKRKALSASSRIHGEDKLDPSSVERWPPGRTQPSLLPTSSAAFYDAFDTRPHSIVIRDARGRSLLHWDPNKFVEYHNRLPSDFPQSSVDGSIGIQSDDPQRHPAIAPRSSPVSPLYRTVAQIDNAKQDPRIRHKRHFLFDPMPMVSQEVITVVDPPEPRLASFRHSSNEPSHRQMHSTTHPRFIHQDTSSYVKRPRGPRPAPAPNS